MTYGLCQTLIMTQPLNQMLILQMRTEVIIQCLPMLTAVIIVGYLAKWLPELVTVVSIGMIIIYLIAGILLMKALFDLRRSISSDSDSNNTDTDIETEEI